MTTGAGGGAACAGGLGNTELGGGVCGGGAGTCVVGAGCTTGPGGGTVGCGGVAVGGDGCCTGACCAPGCCGDDGCGKEGCGCSTMAGMVEPTMRMGGGEAAGAGGLVVACGCAALPPVPLAGAAGPDVVVWMLPA